MGRFTSRNVVHPNRSREIARRTRDSFVALATTVLLLVATGTALADSPNPTSAVGTSVTNANGSITVTANGTWNWPRATSCTKATGYNLDWNDPLQPGNVVGTLNGITYDVGAAVANTFNAADNVIHPTESCIVTNDVANGTWGPIAHTYAAGTPFPLTVCAITYHDKGGTAGGPGHQTDNSVEENNNEPGSDGCFTVAAPPVVSIVTQSAPNNDSAVPGSSASDTATVSGTIVTPTGTVTFFLCGPAAVTAAGCPVGSGSQIGSAVTLSGGTATSASTTSTTAIGTYCWRASYSGDARYASASHTNAAIGTNGECFQVSKRPATLSTTSTPTGGDVTPGTSAHDVATLSGTTGTPSGSVSFFLCAPAQVTAAGCPAGSGTQVGAAVTLNGGAATSSSTSATLATGLYCWRIAYSGDTVYDAGTHTNRGSECFTVELRDPTVTTTADPTGDDIVPGSSAVDHTTVTGTAGTPTGTVTFYLCNPTTSTSDGCTTGVQAGPAKTLIGGQATSNPTTATLQVGRYCWRVHYSGDGTYHEAWHTNGGSECFTVAQRAALLTTTSSPTGGDVTPGTEASDIATVASDGGPTPTGTVTFWLCDPSEVTAAGCPAGGTQIGAPETLVGGEAASNSSDDTLTPGTYCWRAEYSGDDVHLGSVHTNATTECFSTALRSPTIDTTADPNGAGVLPGTEASDSATVTGDGPTPTGTITFWLCQPDEITVDGCTEGGTQVGDPVVLDADGLATSEIATDTLDIGSYCWRAEYSGDDVYVGGVHTNATTECFDTAKAQPSIATIPVPRSTTVDEAIADTATVSDGATPTGTVTFALYDVDDPDCTGDAVFTDVQTLATDGTATSNPFTVTEVGTYRWIATYSGDAYNEDAVSGCQEEQVAVSDVLGGIITRPPLPTTGVVSRSLPGVLALLAAFGLFGVIRRRHAAPTQHRAG